MPDDFKRKNTHKYKAQTITSEKVNNPTIRCYGRRTL